MQIALEEASLAATRGEVPVGCVVVDWSRGEILSRSSNRIEELKEEVDNYDDELYNELVDNVSIEDDNERRQHLEEIKYDREVN